MCTTRMFGASRNLVNGMALERHLTCLLVQLVLATVTVTHMHASMLIATIITCHDEQIAC